MEKLKINNFDIIEHLCKFEPGTYYRFYFTTRKKDNDKLSHDIILKTWLIDDNRAFQCRKKSMLDMLSKYPNARLYLTVDKKSCKTSLQLIRDNCISILDRTENVKNLTSNDIINMMDVTNNSEASVISDRKIVVDIETKDVKVAEQLDDFIGEICDLRDTDNCVVVETKDGFHLIYKRTFFINPEQKQQICEKFAQCKIDFRIDASTLIAMS